MSGLSQAAGNGVGPESFLGKCAIKIAGRGRGDRGRRCDKWAVFQCCVMWMVMLSMDDGRCGGRRRDGVHGMIPGVWEERESEGGDLVPSPDAGVPEWAGGAARGVCFVSGLRGFL